MKKQVNRIRVVQELDSHARTFAVTRTMMGKWSGQTVVEPPDESTKAKFRDERGFTESGLQAVTELMDIPGVSELSFKKSQVTVTKGMAWNWEEIQPAFLSVLREHYFSDAFYDVVVDDCTGSTKTLDGGRRSVKDAHREPRKTHHSMGSASRK